jgi:hypothetical protein
MHSPQWALGRGAGDLEEDQLDLWTREIEYLRFGVGMEVESPTPLSYVGQTLYLLHVSPCTWHLWESAPLWKSLSSISVSPYAPTPSAQFFDQINLVRVSIFLP